MKDSAGPGTFRQSAAVPARLPKPRRTFVLASEVSEAAGVTFVTLRDWVRRGILPAPVESLRGRGNMAKYPPSAVPRADLARRLRDDGWSLDGIAEHIKSKAWDGPAAAKGETESDPKEAGED